MKKTYTEFGQFVRDVAQICHNAQVYNRPSAPIFGAAVRLREVFKQKLLDHVKSGKIRPDEAELPDLGEIPLEESPPPEGEVDEEDEEEDEDDDEDEDEEEDVSEDDEDDRRRSGRGRGGRTARVGRSGDANRRPGRPLRILTPVEARIDAVLRGLRKVKDDEGELRIAPFERLPDKSALPDYYTAIQNPIALDMIKKRLRRKKYQSVDQALADLELMFENAKEYNEEDSTVYEDAVELQKQARILAKQEKEKPDDEFRDEDGKLALPGIEYKGETWRVGDWVHIANPNDPRKPVVAQIFRTWQDNTGHKFVNVCWYYRPEQTVHRFDKHFYENEVFKAGQYRDHRIEEVDGRCFVMFITRYPRGRPRGFPTNKATVYVCESRYNEERFKFNKIKTWAGCLPDEVQDRDYEMDLFPVPQKMKKMPSPIKHLLREDAKETDQLPKPTWGTPNAPPMIGAVHRRPRDANESPPPQPSLPPTPIPRPQMQIDPSRRASIKGDIAMAVTPTYSPAGPPANPVHYVQQFAPARPTATPTPQVPHQAQAHHLQPMPPQIPPPQQPLQHSPHYSAQAYAQQYTPQQMQPAAAAAPLYHHQMPPQIPPPHYDHHRGPSPAMMTPPRAAAMSAAPPPNTTPLPHANSQANQYNMPARSYEVFRILDPELEAAIPPQVREQFHRDDEGRLLFFSSASREPSDNRLAGEYRGLGHSASYLASVHEIRAERRRKRKERDEAAAREQAQEAKRIAIAGEGEKGADVGAEAREEEGRRLVRDLVAWAEDLDRDTEAMKKELGGWDEVKRVEDGERRARVAMV